MLAVWAAKISEKASVHLSPPGCDLGGENCIKRLIQVSCTILQARLEKIFFIVCGTNGKTTTNNMLCAAIEKRRL